MSEILILPDSLSVAVRAAHMLVKSASEKLARAGNFSLVLSGGSTPRILYELLASSEYRDELNWEAIHVFWGDERCVPPDSSDSNYRMAKDTLLDHVGLIPSNIHRIKGENLPQDASIEYETLLHQHYAEYGAFDLVLLGMGEDGHTASLFPHSSALKEHKRWAVSNEVDNKLPWRITLTAEVINMAGNIMFLVAGETKADSLYRVLRGNYDPDNLPAQLINPTKGS
ncbi:MAG: 6-phosphogluconolactonase [Anaerolineae bacterium]